MEHGYPCESGAYRGCSKKRSDRCSRGGVGIDKLGLGAPCALRRKIGSSPDFSLKLQHRLEPLVCVKLFPPAAILRSEDDGGRARTPAARTRR